MSAKRGAKLAPRARSVPLAAFGPVTFGAAVVVTTKFIVAGLLPAMARDL